MKEICICAAVKLADGFIARGHRHNDCINYINNLYKHLGRTVCWDESVQGFMTGYNRFVDRKEGRRLQDEAGIESIGEYIDGTLFSEDLY